MGLIEKLQAKIEIYRLEQKYTRRSKRTTFISDAQYVDGEYIYGASPTSPKSSTSWDRGTAASKRASMGLTMAPVVRIKEMATGGSWR